MKTTSFGLKFFPRSGLTKEGGTGMIYARIRLERNDEMNGKVKPGKNAPEKVGKRIVLPQTLLRKL